MSALELLPAKADAVHGGCPVAMACRGSGRVCGALHELKGGQSQVLSLARGQRIDVSQTGKASLKTVHTGLVAVCVTLPDGRRQLLCLAGPGESLAPVRVHGLDARFEALTATTLCHVEVVADDDEVSADVITVVEACLRARLEDAFMHLVALGRLDGTERTLVFLMDMARRMGRIEEGRWCVELPMSRDDIADYLGLNADTVTRILRRLQQDGLLRSGDSGCWELPDLEALEARLSDWPATQELRNRLAVRRLQEGASVSA